MFRVSGALGIDQPLQGYYCKVLEIKPGVAVVKQDIFVEPASAVTVKIQDAEGRPLTGVWATGISSRYWNPAHRIEKDTCSAYHMEADKPRLMVFFEPSKKLAGTLTLKGDEKQPVVVKLGPTGSVRGRLLGEDGKPLAGVVVDLDYRDREANSVHEVIYKAKQVVTDAAGAFALDELIPELRFELSFRRGKRKYEGESKPAEATLQVKPGECRDLGAIKLKQVPEKADE